MQNFVANTWRVLRMDFLRLRWFWLLWTLLAGLLLWLKVSAWGWPGLRGLVLTMVVLAMSPVVVSGHRALGTAPWWKTRPLAGTPAALAKFVTVVLVFTVIALAEGAHLLSIGMQPWLVFVVEAQRWAGWFFLAILLAWLASMSCTWRDYWLACGLTILAAIGGAMLVAKLDTLGVQLPHLDLVGDANAGRTGEWTAAGLGLLLVAALVVVYRQGRRLHGLFLGIALLLVFPLIPLGVSYLEPQEAEGSDGWFERLTGKKVPAVKRRSIEPYATRLLGIVPLEAGASVCSGRESMTIEELTWLESWDEDRIEMHVRFETCRPVRQSVLRGRVRNSEDLRFHLLLIRGDERPVALGAMGRVEGVWISSEGLWDVERRWLFFRPAEGVEEAALDAMRADRSLRLAVVVHRPLRRSRLPGEAATEPKTLPYPPPRKNAAP